MGTSRFGFVAGAALGCCAAACAADRAAATNAVRWEADIARFEAADRLTSPPTNAVLFVGSSSIRLWKTMAADFPGVKLIQRGVGGCFMSDVVHYADRIVIPYRPSLIVVYAGDNDLAAGRTPERVLADFDELCRRVRTALPGVRVAFLPVKPSTARWRLIAHIRRVNDGVRDRAARDPAVLYIDTFTPMLGADGQPRADLLADDGLHLNAAGYALWARIVAPFLP